MSNNLHRPSQDEVLAFHSTLSNWGRWGNDDEKGTLNLIDAAATRRGVASVRHGTNISCSWELHDGPDGVERTNAIKPTGTSEWLSFKFHNAAFTHLDALTHKFWDGRSYNGRSTSEVDHTEGATFGSVVAAADGIITRGVLFDIAALRGVDWLALGEGIYPEDLDAAAELHGVDIEPGDAILVRTGECRRRRETGQLPAGGQAGIHASCLPWLREHDIALLAADIGTDVVPSGYPDIPLPVHTVALVAMGLWLIDHCDLEACARLAEALEQATFLLSVGPVRFPPGTSGSPVNPIATF